MTEQPLLPQFALDCDNADDMGPALDRIREQYGKLDENLRIRCWAQALQTRRLPIHCLEALEQKGCVPLLWVWQMGNLEGVDWRSALAWWAKGGQQDRLEEIGEAASYSLWQAEEFSDLEQHHPYSNLANAILETLATYSYSEHDFLGRCGCKTPGNGAMLMIMAAMYPENTWMEKAGLDPVHLLWEGLNHPLMAYNLLVPQPGGSLLERWRAADPRHEQAWKRVLDTYQHEVDTLGQWLDEWLPGNAWKDSPLATWCANPTPKGQRPHPLDSFSTGGLNVEPYKIGKTLARMLEGGGSEHERRHQLNAVISELYGNATRKTPDYPPGPAGLALCPTREDARTESWLNAYALTEKGRSEILEVLNARNADRAAGKLPMERILGWMENDPEPWVSWRNTRGQSLFEMWRHEANSTTLAVKASTWRVLAEKAPSWLSQPDSRGLCAIDTLDLSDDLRSELKRTLLERELGATPHTSRVVRRF